MLIVPELEIYEIKITPPYSEKEKMDMYDYFVQQHQHLLQTDSKYNKPDMSLCFVAEEYREHMNSLYDTFVDVSKKFLGDFTLSSNNSRNCWAIVLDRYRTDPQNIIHDHIKTSDINAAYYFSVPSDSSGKLYFFDDNKNIIYEHQPLENSFLIFPCYLKHSPTGCHTNRLRITLNMEIRCEENVWRKKYK